MMLPDVAKIFMIYGVQWPSFWDATERTRSRMDSKASSRAVSEHLRNVKTKSGKLWDTHGS